tara:strand:- start:650 stop:814 length:165 start_codon:yes stop_codon:yes gene_type:complete
MALEDAEGVLNTAGFWTVGVLKGVAIAAVPIVAFSMVAGFAFKLARIGAGIGGK